MKINQLVTGTFCTALLFGSTGVQAANFTVDDALDGADINPGDGLCVTSGNSCTLRAAVMETNSLSGADTITLPAGLYTLALGNTGEDAAAEGDLDILDDLTITGADAATTTVNGNSFLYRIFSILERSDNTLPTVNISNITLTQGLDSNAGALISNGGDLRLNNVILMDANPNNYALVSSGNLTITDSQIINNSAGIFTETGNVEITGTTFDGNDGGNNVGGTFFLNSGSAIISNSTFSNNIAYDFGGAIFQGRGRSELVIDNSSFTNNTVTLSPNTFRGNGGAIASRGGTLEITNSSFDNNHVSDSCFNSNRGSGGAILISETDFVGIDNSSFTNNSSSCDGGAILVDEGSVGSVYFRRLTVDGNSSQNGGGIFIGGGGGIGDAIVISESRVTNNVASGAGGGIAFSTSTFASSDLNYQITHSEISGNTADIAGGIYANGNGITFQNLTISDNFATTNGGGFYLNQGSNELTQVTIANNNSPAATGSNIVNNTGTLNFNHIIVDNPLGGGTNCAGIITSMGNNIVSDASCGIGLVSGDQASTDPLLAALTDNGGFSNTLALQASSPAINAGSATYCNSVNPLDQRYFYRGDAICDVGAFEASSSIAQPGTLAFTATDFTVNEDVGTASITLSRTNGSQGDVSLFISDNRQGTATSGSDYTSVPISVIEWSDGDSSNKTLDIAIIDDATEESSESIQLQIESSAFVTGGASIGTSATTLLINANDAPTPTPTPTNNNNTGSSNSTSSAGESSGAFHPLMFLILFALNVIRRRFQYDRF